MSRLSRSQMVSISAEILDVSVDASDKEIDDAHRQKVLDYHPDVGEESDRDKFIALSPARDILKGEFDFTDSDKVKSASDKFTKFADVDPEVHEPDSVTSQQDVGDVYGIQMELTARVLVDLVISDMMALFKQGIGKEDITNRIVIESSNRGFTGQSFNNMTVPILMDILSDMIRDDVDNSQVEQLLVEADQQVMDRFGESGDMFNVSQTLAALIAGGVVTMGDIGGVGPRGEYRRRSGFRGASTSRRDRGGSSTRDEARRRRRRGG